MRSPMRTTVKRQDFKFSARIGDHCGLVAISILTSTAGFLPDYRKNKLDFVR
jgi:hypothetical protein